IMSDIIKVNTPHLGSLYTKLFFSSKPKLCLDTNIPDTEFLMESVKIDKEHLRSFNNLCGYKHQKPLITYPYTLTGKLLLILLSHESIPVKAAGTLHLKNIITLHQEFSLSDTFSISAKVSNSYFSDKGLEFEIIFKISNQQKLVWECSSFFLKRSSVRVESFQRDESYELNKLDPENYAKNTFSIPANIGKKYAKISSDYNPIHVSNIAAKLFGHSRSIAHGMWVISKVLSLKSESIYSKVNVEFKGPSPTASEAFYVQEQDSINVFCQGNPRPVILCSVK
ncbi:MAG: hypothetical protein NE330_18930, partial [Lentisphaeraceae bacterium]|nr:hypothetical protein [Lentisphaeraceae bacterium]